MQETLVQFLGREDLLERGTATHTDSSLEKSDTTERLSLSLFCYANMYWPPSLTNHLMPIISHVNQRVSQFSSVQFSHSVVSNSLWPHESQPGLHVHHQLPESTQTHVHQGGDAIQPSHPLSSPSPPAPNPSQHQGLFQWVNSSHEVAKVLEFQFQLQLQSFQWTPRTDLL